MLDRDKKYIFAISGGPDSIFLLNQHLFMKNNIVVCHVNYNFRTDSNVDQKIVEEICIKNNIKLEVLNLNKDYDQLEENFEQFARNVRYDFFIENIKKYNADGIVLGHNLNDHIETYIMQKKRNGIFGFYGIKEITKYRDTFLYRPIIHLKKSEIIKALNKLNLKYAIDYTNNDPKYLRNKIRLKLDESNFDLYLNEINQKNSDLKNLKKKFIIENEFDVSYLSKFKLNEKLFILFNWIKLVDSSYNIEKRKNKTLSEILKQIESKKSYIKFKLNEKSIIKDRKKVFVFNNNHINVQLKIENIEQINELDFIKNKEEIVSILSTKKAIFISNNFLDYQKQFTINNIKLQKFFLKNKTSYKFKLENPIIYEEKTTFILNKW